MQDVTVLPKQIAIGWQMQHVPKTVVTDRANTIHSCAGLQYLLYSEA